MKTKTTILLIVIMSCMTLQAYSVEPLTYPNPSSVTSQGYRSSPSSPFGQGMTNSKTSAGGMKSPIYAPTPLSPQHSSIHGSAALSPIGALSPEYYGCEVDSWDINQKQNSRGRRKTEENPEIPFRDPIGDMPWLLVVVAIIGLLARRRYKSNSAFANSHSSTD